MMLENKIIYLLNKVLEPYIGGIDQNKLHWNNLLSGKVILNGLHLKPCIVDYLNLPFHLTFGLIDHVSIKVHLPILSLSKRKLVVEISDVILLLTAIPESQWDPKAYREEYVAQKIATLASESLQLVVKEIEGGGFLWKTLVSFLENLEVMISNVQIRVEDYTTNPDVSYAFGGIVKSAVFLTGENPSPPSDDDPNVDTPFRKAFYKDDGTLNPNIIHRTIELKGVGLYIDRLDPLRPGMMRSDTSMDESFQKDAPKSRHSGDSGVTFTGSADHTAFMDAISYGSQNTFNAGVGSRGMILTHTLRNNRIRYMSSNKRRPLRKAFRIKNRRADNHGRHRLRCIRYLAERSDDNFHTYQRCSNVLTSNSHVYSCIVTRVMDYLTTGEHNDGCECTSINGWQHNSTVPPHAFEDGNVRAQATGGTTVFDGTLLDGLMHAMKNPYYPRRVTRHPLPKDRHMNIGRRQLPTQGGAEGSSPSATNQGDHSSDDNTIGRRRLSFSSEHSDVGSVASETANMLANSLGYNLSSGSSWRILLSTFCDIQQPSDGYKQQSIDLISQAQTRYHQRNIIKRSSKSDMSSRCLSTEDLSAISLTEIVAEFDGASGANASETTLETSSNTDPPGGLYSLCGDMDCAALDDGPYKFNEDDFNSDMAAPFSYDETWHVYNCPQEPGSAEDANTVAESLDEGKGTTLPTEDGIVDTDVGNKTDIWTRFTFVLNRKENVSMKELFLRTMEESEHNYILNPKEFSGMASFYVCMYPTPPYGKSHSCWSAWGREREFKFQNARMSIAKDYLPRCTVFLAFHNLNLVLSKDQYDCIMNLILENIIKYLNWQAGIIYTFENPRASRSDEKAYMEYWPQYLLLGQTSKKNELRQFIKDFEILHSMQAIRILRKSASEGLRDLIRRFGNRRNIGSCDLGINECITDVLFTNICGQFDDDDVSTVHSGQDDSSRLQARLRLVGGIYEIATRHAKSSTFLDSLRKICQPATLTLDFALDLTLMNSRITFMFDTESHEESIRSGKSYVLSGSGVHFFISDVYGRDGCQFMEIELLPFSVVSFGFGVSSIDTEYRSLTDCACALMDGPATLLLSCNDLYQPSPSPVKPQPERPQRMRGLDRLKALKRDFALGFRNKEDPKPTPVEDSSVYLAMSFNRFCTPEEADMRILCHLNCDLFGHLRVIEEFKDYLRLRKYNKRYHDTLDPVRVKAKRKQHLYTDTEGFYRECYQLIDLGVEYARNLLQGSIPFMNIDFFIEENHQTVLYVDFGSSMQSMPYFVSIDSFAVASEVTPRLLDSQEESPYDSHILRLSNLRVLRANGDYTFISDSGRRDIYLDGPSSMQLSKYLDLVASVEPHPGYDDPAVSSLLKEFQSNFELVRIGGDHDVFIKLKCANSNYSNRSTPNIVVTIALDSAYISARELDILDFLGAYADYVTVFNDYKVFMGYYTDRVRPRSQGSPDLQKANQDVFWGPFTESTRDTGSVISDNTLYRDYALDFRGIVNQKWMSLQHKLNQHLKDKMRRIMYECKVDYVFVEVRRHISLEKETLGAISLMGQDNCSPPVSPLYSSRAPQSDLQTVSSFGKASVKHDNANTVQHLRVGTLLSRRFISSIEENPDDDGANEVSSIHSDDAMISHHATMCCLQDAITRYGITLPLVSLKLTGIGVKVGLSDQQVETMRISLGCIELEDQTNALPLYTSTLFVGGDAIAFWRWLKVRREVYRVRSCLQSYSEDLNKSMSQLLSKKSRDGSHVKPRRIDPKLRQRLCHIDYSSIRFDYRLNHDYVEPPFFALKKGDDKVEVAYRRIEKYLESVMDCTCKMDTNVMRNDAHAVKINCFLTASLDSDKNGNGHCVVNVSNAMLNVAWEVIDEITGICLRISEYASNIPQMIVQGGASTPTPPHGDTSGPSTPQDDHWSINTMVTVEHSCIHIICDSAWVGYNNFVRFMWFKLLRDAFNIVDPESTAVSRMNSLVDSNDARSSVYHHSARDKTLHRGHPSHAGQYTIDSHSGKQQREQHPRMYSKDFHLGVGTGHHIGLGRDINSRIRWMFVRSLLRDPHCKAYLTGPIYMRISGRGSLSLGFSSLSKEQTTTKDSTVRQNRVILGRMDKWFSNYLPCAVQLRVCGTNVSVGLTREFSRNVLSSCGFVMIASGLPSHLRDGFKSQHLEFLKYIRPHSRRDKKFFGLLELSKHTLYDSSEPNTSLFIEPFRFDITCGSLLYSCDSMNRGRSIPQCVCFTVHLEALKGRFNCVDILCICNLISLVSGFIDLQSGDDLRFGGQTRTDPKESIPLLTMPSVDQAVSVKDDIADDDSTIDDFHSCNSSDSGSDWSSVSSSDTDEEPPNQDMPEVKDMPEKIRQKRKVQKKRGDPNVNLGLFDELLSFFNFGCLVKLDLVHIEVSSHSTDEIKNQLTITLEDVNCSLWSNQMNILCNRISTHKRDVTSTKGENSTEDIDDSGTSDLITISESYMPEIEGRMAFCMATIGNMIYNGRNQERVSSTIGNSSSHLLIGEAVELNEYFFKISDLSKSLLRFESHLCLTVDICTGARHEMVVEPVNICFRGTKPSVGTKTLTSLNTSWINTNISLNGAHCVFGFLKYFTEMRKLRMALLETHHNEFISFQPAIVCSLETDVNTTMIPLASLPGPLQMHFRRSIAASRAVTDSHLPVTNIPEVLTFRLKNNSFRGSRYLDLHRCLLLSLKNLSSLNVGGPSPAPGGLGSLTIGIPTDTFGKGVNTTVEKGGEQHSYLFNTLGQPIAVCLHTQSSYKVDKDSSWRVIGDGESCILPVGYYGILLPFVVRIQLNNCVYEIPSSMLDLNHNDEFVIRLDISRRHPRDHRANRIGFLSNLQQARLRMQTYRFGLMDSCAHVIDNDLEEGNFARKGSARRKNDSNKEHSPRVFHRPWTSRRRKRNLLRNVERNQFRYAYVMVRTLQRSGTQVVSGGSATTHFSIYLSSVLWISNKSQEKIVVFPSVGIDEERRAVPTSSLVWLFHHDPVTSSLPLAPKTVESNRVIAGVKSVGNNLFKQLTSIQDSKQAIKRLHPTHVLNPMQLKEEIENIVPEFKLQYILLKEFSDNQHGVAIPLSWTIEPSCTIAVCLQEDFPVDISIAGSDITLECLDSNSVTTPPDFPLHFTGDVLLSRKSAQYMYESFEQTRIKTPIPGYVAKVNLGNLDVNDILASDLRTGFVQDIGGNTKSKELHTTRSQSFQRTGRKPIASARNRLYHANSDKGFYKGSHSKVVNRKAIRTSTPDNPSESDTLDNSAFQPNNIVQPINYEKDGDSLQTAESAPNVTSDAVDPAEGLLLSVRSRSDQTDAAYTVMSKTVARVTLSSKKESSVVSGGIIIKRRTRMVHANSLRTYMTTQKDGEDTPFMKEGDNVVMSPKAILSSTLIEVSESSRSRFGMKSGRTGIKHYEISLENCHIIENMMPFDIHIINPATFDHLNRSSSIQNDVEDTNPVFNPILIKASNRSQFSWYLKSGRFVLKELISREFTVKVPTETVAVSSLVFESMQPKFFEEIYRLVDPSGSDVSGTSSGTLPRRMVLSVETSRKPVEPVKNRNGVINRFLASSQVVYTIFADKWIVSWLNYPISLCRGDGRYKQTIPGQNCTLVSQDLSSTNLQLAIRKSTLKQISNFANYPKRAKRRFLSFDTLGDTHVMSNTFTLPDLAFSTCGFSDTVECPKLHYLVSTSMAPAPFFRTSVLEILPQTTLTNEFNHRLWLRETDSYKPTSFSTKERSCGWYVMEPGETLEFHSQVKGELTIEITGIDPHSVENVHSTTKSTGDKAAFHIWSSGIALKPSHLTQFRYPSALQISKRDAPSKQNPECSSEQSRAKSRNKSLGTSISRSLCYGLCEVEVRMHHGAKMVRFMNPIIADWILLNTTGVDLWVEQHGVPGYGEIVPTVVMDTRFISEDYAGRGVPFACYDPFKEHKLVCRFHLAPNMFKTLNGGGYSKSGRRNSERTVGTSRWTQPMALLNNFPLRGVINKQAAGRPFRMKGSLLVNLSRVESMKCSSVFQIRSGGTILSVRLTAQTTVIFGQKTLHFTAVALPLRNFPRLQRIHPTNLLNIYSELKNRLHVPRKLGYGRKGAGAGTRLKGSFRRLVTSGLYRTKTSPFSTSRPSKYTKRFLPSFNERRTRGLKRNPEEPVLKTQVVSARNEGFFNWEYVFQVNILGLGVAICSGVNEEILYISGTLIKFMVTLDKGGHIFALSLGWIQSDVHDPSTCYPTMIRPLASWYSPIHNYDLRKRGHKGYRRHIDIMSDHDQKEPHVLTIKFSTITNKYFSLREITNCHIELEPLSLNLDTRISHSILMLVDEYISIFGFLGATSDYFTTANVGIFSNVDNWLRNFDVAQYPLKEVARSQFSSALGSGTRYNISNLHVGKITLAINIRRSLSRISSDLQPENVIIRYLMHILRRTPHISDANIILAQESLLELCCTPYALLSHFAMRYITQGVQQIYKVLGAVDLIGNPKIVLHHWLTGCRHAMSLLRESLQYVHMPPIMVYLWVRSASRIGTSFVSGIMDAFYRLTGSWYLMFNTLACNADRYAVVILQDTFKNSMNQPSNIMEGIAFGGRAFGRNLYASMANFALKPLHQLVRVFNSMKTARGINGDVMLSILHIFGSLFSSLASLGFGSISSLLSGVSVISQGILNQIHSVPMLSAIRPQRSPKVLKTSGPIRYNFLESWSMNGSRHLKTINELLLLLPMDSKVKLFDPLYAATLHWSALSEHMGKISPIEVCRPSSSLSTFFWINRTHMGFLDRRKIRWICENRGICSIEIYRVPATNYQCPNVVRYNDSIVVNMQPKKIKKYFSAQDTFYMRIIHVASNWGQLMRKGCGKVPSPLLHRLMDAKTFPSEGGPQDKLHGLFHMQNIRETPLMFASDGAGGGYHACGSETLRSQASFTSVQHFYQDNKDPTRFDLGGVIIDKYERSVETTYQSISSQQSLSQRDDDVIIAAEAGEGMPTSFDSGNINDANVEASSDARSFNCSSSGVQAPKQTHKVAEVMRLPNLETARLYFTLIVSVLKEATL